MRPDVVFNNYPPGYESYLEGWKSHGLQTLCWPLAADTFVYKKMDLSGDIDYDCDVAFIGGYWPYKGQNLARYILPLIQEFNCCIYGNGWGPYGKGYLADPDMSNVMSRARVCPCIHEPHATALGTDVSERVFKVCYAGGMPLCDNVEGLRILFPQVSMRIAENLEDFLDEAGAMIRRPQAFYDWRRQLQQYVAENHTYLIRCQQMLDLLEIS